MNGQDQVKDIFRFMGDLSENDSGSSMTSFGEEMGILLLILGQLVKEGFGVAQTALSFSLFEQEPVQGVTLPGDQKPIPGGSPIAQCDVSYPQLLQITSVELNPNPPQRGQNLTINASGVLKTDIQEGAYVDVEVKYGYIKLISQTYDLCEEVGEVDLQCPLKAGEYKLTKTVEIPQQVPPGKYTVVARAYTDDDDFIACITGTVVFTVDGLMSYQF
ncbi:hypothetical protein WICPIJ_006135 [Wickerhamomyces pijperi]|uniref:Phosphatidylglycerol/phosphatidylinositol transfer protein n=1 Tax=Wickerhamomyces pijperi TaxID=599730 RepID=A0A9P8Q4D5_WICPI|nr:hypothetical protein WICPIJ_006135 [Wickerhamomyces pijperi]